MRRVRVFAAAAIAVCVLASCERGRPEVAPGAAPVVGSDIVQAVMHGKDLAEGDLEEPQPKTDRERFLVKAAEIYSFCDAWKIIEDIPEPQPDDPDALVDFGTVYYDTLRYIDTSKKVLEKVQSRGSGPATSKRVELSEEAKADIKALRHHVYGYLKRVVAARIALDQKVIDERYAAERFEAAFLKLSADNAQTVYQRLTNYAYGHCTF